MLKIIVLVLSIFALTSAQKNSFEKDVDVFNVNFNRNQRNANHHLLRSFDVVPSNVSEILII